ncbi:MAG: hypothetical protein NT013_18955 [Planctomycetia bacterium]|nr:hypothetical protein [Planctomycetia bacterium]
MRYAIATLIAALLIIIGLSFCIHTEWSVRRFVEKGLRENNDGRLSKDEEDTLNSSLLTPVILLGFGNQISGYLVLRIQLADLLRQWWFAWTALSCCVPFGIAHWIRQLTPQQESQS